MRLTTLIFVFGLAVTSPGLTADFYLVDKKCETQTGYTSQHKMNHLKNGSLMIAACDRVRKKVECSVVPKKKGEKINVVGGQNKKSTTEKYELVDMPPFLALTSLPKRTNQYLVDTVKGKFIFTTSSTNPGTKNSLMVTQKMCTGSYRTDSQIKLKK